MKTIMKSLRWILQRQQQQWQHFQEARKRANSSPLSQNKVDCMRVILCLLSVLLLCLIGLLGEGVLNFPYVQDLNKGFVSLPAATEVVVDNFRLGNSDFVLSLTPFMFMFFVFLWPSSSDYCLDPERFWFGFVGIWILALGYFALFLLALHLPFLYLHSRMGTSLVPIVTWSINAVIFAIGIIYCRLQKKQSRAESTPSGDR
jgi:hypothetical protein